MKIRLTLPVFEQLLAYSAATRLEYSGFGFCTRDGRDIVVYDFVLLNVGSEAYTEIPPEKILPLLDREDARNMKVWVHMHPMGDGVPGPHNWSPRDELTIQKEPLGSTPEMCSWSVSIVMTLGGFVGRIDNYITGKTKHLEVEPATMPYFQEIRALAKEARPAPSGQPFLVGDDDEWEEGEAWEEEDTWADDDTEMDVVQALQVLIRRYPNARDYSLADLCDQWGIGWEFEEEEYKRMRRLF